MSMLELTAEYQRMLELARTHPEVEEIQEDLAKARDAMEIAWCDLLLAEL